MITFWFYTFISISTRNTSNIESIMLRRTTSCLSNSISQWKSITRSINFLIFASIASFSSNQSWSALIVNAIITWRANVEISILIWSEIIKVKRINQIETIETTNEEEKTTKTITTTSMTIAITTTRTLKSLINCTSSWSSKRCRQWTSCSLQSFSELWTVHVFNTAFEKNRRSSFTRRSRNSFLSTI
jgi:hypothetical protein